MHHPINIWILLSMYFEYNQTLLNQFIDALDPTCVLRSINPASQEVNLLIALLRTHFVFGNYDMIKIFEILSNFVVKIEKVNDNGWQNDDIDELHVAAKNMKISFDNVLSIPT